jgi:NADPH-dependent curcumin reductase CurA
MTKTHQRIVLASRPHGRVTPENFRLERVPLPEPGAGQLRVRVHYLSLDPYMRGRMEETKSYAESQKLGETMIGGTVGVVDASNHPDYAVGDTVVGMAGWQEFALSDGSMLMKVDPRVVPMPAYLGPVGMPGVTAWYGLNRICEPTPGQTVLVSAASGAVGSVVGQLAKQAGCRTIGIAGGPEKCAYVVAELGFDACLDHRAHGDVGSLVRALRAAAPAGVDALFENVGGACLDAALACMNPFGRVALCGLIAGYNGEDIALQNVRALLVSRLKVQGFIVSDHMDAWPAALAELGRGVAAGTIRYRETVAQGLAAAPEAFIGLLAGRNFGKQLVKLA